MPMESTSWRDKRHETRKIPDNRQFLIEDSGCHHFAPSCAHTGKKIEGVSREDSSMPIKLAARPPAGCALLALALIASTASAQAQYTAKEWPEGPMKQRFTEACGGCHDINRVRVGYTPKGWLTVVRMMQNFDTPVAPEEWPAMTEYLMKNFPERARPSAVILSGPVKARIDLWDVPTQGSRPHDPLAAKDGSIWWTGQLATSSAASTQKPARFANTL